MKSRLETALRDGVEKALARARRSKQPKAIAPPPNIASTYTELPTLAQVERDYVEHVLREVHGNFEHAGRILGINRKTLYRKTARWGVSRSDFVK